MTGVMLAAENLDALTSGYGDGGAITDLQAGQLRKRSAQLGALATLADRFTDPAESARISDHVGRLRKIQRLAPKAVAEVLLYPFAGVWLTSALRRLRETDAPSALYPEDQSYLGWLVAAAAVISGVECTVPVSVQGGAVLLPGLGMARFDQADAPETAVVEVHATGARITAAGASVDVPADPAVDVGCWLGVRRLRSRHGLGAEVRLDDLDPLRGRGLSQAAAPRLTEAEVASWQKGFDDAWELLNRHHRPYVEALRAGLICIVPLALRPGQNPVSMTMQQAFGSVAASQQRTVASLAVALVHEFQHGKLAALLDVTRLYEAGDGTDLFYAPWRNDPRPLGALLQGVYAHFGVTDFWRAQRTVSRGDEATLAHVEFKRWGVQTAQAIENLRSSDRFTATGRQMLTTMAGRLDSWLTEPVPAEPGRLAQEIVAEHHLGWRVRNLGLDQAVGERLARAWVDGTPCPSDIDVRSVPAVEAAATERSSGRLVLLYLRLNEPDRFAALATRPPDLLSVAKGATQADLDYLDRNYRAAADGYVAQIAAGNESWQTWTGLALISPHLAAPQAAAGLRGRPEVVAHVHRAVRRMSAQRPDPFELAAWLAPALTAEG